MAFIVHPAVVPETSLRCATTPPIHPTAPLLKKVELQCIARPESASPATGSKKAHELQQKEIIEKVFGK
jgi:2-oxoglutarate dehydrogenase complex dehydrogenase (E1) component-like enzyme